MVSHEEPGRCMTLCGRFNVLFLGVCAMASSVLVIFSCQFFSYRTLDGQPWEGFEPPFDTLTKASVGLFSYSKVTTRDKSFLFGDECIEYSEWTEAGQNQLFYVAQWCSMFAPGAAFLAWVQILLEMCCCRLRGGYLFICFFFVSASILQGCTFMVFTDSEFCFEAASENQCTLQNGAWFSLGSTAAYLILAILSCALRPYPGLLSRCRCFITTYGIGRDVIDNEVDAEKAGGGGSTSSSEGDGVWHDGGHSDVTSGNWEDFNGDESILKSKSSTLISSVGLNEHSEAGSLAISSKQDEATAVDPPAANLDAFKDEDLQKQLNNILLQNADASKNGRKPDFLDICCGDPLHLEKHLADGEKGKKREKRGSGNNQVKSTSNNNKSADTSK